MPDFLHGIETLEISDGIRSISTVKSAVIGLVGTAPDADVAKFPVNEPVLLTGPKLAAELGATGTLGWAIDGIYDQIGAAIVVVRVEEGVDDAATMTNVGGAAADQTGVHALMTAESELGVSPRLLIAPGWTHQRPDDNPNPVMTELKALAGKLRAIAIVDGPNTDDATAITAATDAGSDRVYLVEWAKVWDAATSAYIAEPASGRAAGVIARTDIESGFWHSPSNKPMQGVAGSGRPIGFWYSDPNSQANLLNEANVACVVRADGFRLWGNRTTGGDSQWAFLSVRRTADLVYDSVERSHLWAIDKPFSSQLFRDIRDGVQAYLRQLKGLGAIAGGRCWLDEELNTPASLAAGQLWVDFDLEPVGPLERLTFRAHRNGGYYEELLQDAIQAA